MNHKDIAKYERRAQQLRDGLRNMRKVEVRDVVRILGLRSTSHALTIMHEFVQMGHLKYEPPQNGAKYGDYYLIEVQ